MRLVDIFYKNIEGQLSEAKGNLNNIGHIVFSAIGWSEMAAMNGYFEVDGSIVVNAKKNYPDLFNVLLTEAAAGHGIARLKGDDILLSGRGGNLSATGEHKDVPVGYYRGNAMVDHSHNYWQGEQVFTSTSTVTLQVASSSYLARSFIYHGVH